MQNASSRSDADQGRPAIRPSHTAGRTEASAKSAVQPGLGAVAGAEAALRVIACPYSGRCALGDIAVLALTARGFRNPTAHDPRLHREVTDDELLEALTMMSMVHRRLDTACCRVL